MRNSALLAVVLAGTIACVAQTQQPNTTSAQTPLATAQSLYQSGKFHDASDAFAAVLKNDPKSLDAKSGLIRSLLREHKVDEAYDLASTAANENANSAELKVVLGDVQFRRAEMSESEKSYIAALRLDSKQADALLGLARIYRAYSLYRHSYDALQVAHRIAPNDPEVAREWMNTLPRKERIAALEAYLAGPHADDEKETKWMHEEIDLLKAIDSTPHHSCNLVSTADHTETDLERMFTGGATHLSSVGLKVGINGRNNRLELDTGASGILIGRRSAEKAGLKKLSDSSIMGIGDKGEQGGYTALADVIKVGGLEFHDCVVQVSNRLDFTDEDGLIGADVFDSYLVTIDMPKKKLLLSPLPNRPDEVEQAHTLSTQGTNEQEGVKEGDKADKQAGPATAVASVRLPQDRYVAPEMQSWVKAFRFGHEILVPAAVNKSDWMWFLVDTGAFGNTLSLNTAQKFSKASRDEMFHVRGVSGEVKNVYRADNVTLTFAHFREEHQNIVTFDLSGMSNNTGTEVSGILGFDTLRVVTIKLDYRDGLVDFEYDPKRVSQFEQ